MESLKSCFEQGGIAMYDVKKNSSLCTKGVGYVFLFIYNEIPLTTIEKEKRYRRWKKIGNQPTNTMNIPHTMAKLRAQCVSTLST